MAKKLVYHQNEIGHEINESLEKYGSNDREIYCRKLHKITEPNMEDCMNCKCMAGWMMGRGHECVWEDLVDTFTEVVRIPHKDAQKEFLRVSKLIDEGVLEKEV